MLQRDVNLARTRKIAGELAYSRMSPGGRARTCTVATMRSKKAHKHACTCPGNAGEGACSTLDNADGAGRRNIAMMVFASYIHDENSQPIMYTRSTALVLTPHDVHEVPLVTEVVIV